MTRHKNGWAALSSSSHSLFFHFLFLYNQLDSTYRATSEVAQSDGVTDGLFPCYFLIRYHWAGRAGSNRKRRT